MLDKRQPRHTIRAQGRSRLKQRGDSEPSKNNGAPAPFPTSSAKEYSRLLDYLSNTPAGADRTILDHATTDAIVSSSSAAQMLESWFNAGSKNKLDDSLDSTASEGYWPGESHQYSLEEESNAGRYPGNYSGGYFGTEGRPNRAERALSRRVQREIEGAHGAGGPGAYLRSLRREVEGVRGPSAQKIDLSRCGSPVEVTEEASGSRVETFPTGARVFKDGIGHVREIVSAGGVTVTFKYDDQGHLSAFVRTDSRGTIHSLAEADRHGVVLRDACGRVKAQGESMQVDACGCVSIAREDGQFWSLDLVRNVNIERRLLPDEHGNWFSMTALFSSDGFRMATRFRKVRPEDLSFTATASGGYAPAVATASSGPAQRMVDGTIATLAPGRIDFLSQEDSGTYRFYGRDGSVIDFASDDELKQLKPSRVMSASSRQVEPSHRGKRQAGTAWEALREYVFNYLAAL
ncbi:MAG: RHS repeat protein [Cyanobacteria bacterium SZAS LIN-2]|nr:RHS repeat protein [Cyanobacteria bacterium SZAS LIN-2]